MNRRCTVCGTVENGPQTACSGGNQFSYAHSWEGLKLPKGTLHQDNYDLLLEKIEEFADSLVSEYGGNISDFIELLRDIADSNEDMYFDEDAETQARLAKGGNSDL